MYSEIQKPEIIKGVKKWQNRNGFTVLMVHYTADDEKDPDRKGQDWFMAERKGTIKAIWDKEYEIDFATKSGKLVYGKEFCDFDKNVHFINSFELPEPYELLMSLDFGQRNPTCGLVGAWTKDKRLYIIDEYYKAALPSASSKEMMRQFEYLTGQDLSQKSIRSKRDIMNLTFQLKVIDPSTLAKNRSRIRDGEEIPYSVIEEFEDNGWEFEPANNDLVAGINRVREYMQIDESGKSHLYIFKDKCPNLCTELLNYRYKELSELQERVHNLSEEPVKKNDHGCDSLRYMCMSRPHVSIEPEKDKTWVQRDIESKLRPKIISHDWDSDN